MNVECFLLIKTHGIDFVKHPPFSYVLTLTITPLSSGLLICCMKSSSQDCSSQGKYM